MLDTLFWMMLFVVFYTYLGYGLLIYLIVKIRGKNLRLTNRADSNDLPRVVHLIAAYNEENYIDDKITNSLNLSYPRDKYEVWVVTDGSSDGTAEITKKRKEVRHFHQDTRMGKIHAVNRVMPLVESDIVVFSDANTQINQDGLLNMVMNYSDPKVGVVAGEKRIHMDDRDVASSAGEGLYWKYESFLKQFDYYLYSTVGAAGELFSIRTNLFEKVPDDTIIEDFYLSMRIAAEGYRIAYEPTSYAVEHGSDSVKEESKRKIRIAAGGLQAIWRLRDLFNISRYGWLSFQFVSHRVLRWTLAPLFLPFILIINGVLALDSNIFYGTLLSFQIIFYLLALMGWVLQFFKTKVKVFFVPFYFVFMNWAVYIGFIRVVSNKQSAIWERAKRKE
jgi:biofilm PGA synthesis N-glycosyltransferase PgaC